MVRDDPAIAPSARRHGATDEVIRHAFDHPMRSFDLDDGLVMLIARDLAGNLLEIGVVVADDGPVIVHAMPARDKYLR